MNYGALLIGFEYHKNKQWDTLPGIPVDLYQVYTYIKYLNRFKILIYTDLSKDHKTDVLKRAIVDGYVDSGLLSFIEDIKTRNEHQLYLTEGSNGYFFNNFDETFIKFIKGLDRLFLYYTGHGKSGNIILPDGTHVGMEYIKSLLNEHMKTNCQIVSIFDCCEFDGLSLTSPPTSNHISIGSTTISQEIVTTKTGSEFTRLVISLFKDKKMSLENYEYVFTSHPNIKYLWNWFIFLYHNNITVNIDNNLSIIKVILHNCQPHIDDCSSFHNYLRYY
jgi:hypothetical protein